MHAKTKKRGFYFVLTITIVAGVFAFISTSIMQFQKLGMTFTGATMLAVLITSSYNWKSLMREKESKKNGAKAGRRTVAMAYPLMGIIISSFMTVIESKNAEFLEAILSVIAASFIVTFFGLLLTGWASIPIGWFIGQNIAHDFVDTEVFD